MGVQRQSHLCTVAWNALTRHCRVWMLVIREPFLNRHPVPTSPLKMKLLKSSPTLELSTTTTAGSLVKQAEGATLTTPMLLTLESSLHHHASQEQSATMALPLKRQSKPSIGIRARHKTNQLRWMLHSMNGNSLCVNSGARFERGLNGPMPSFAVGSPHPSLRSRGPSIAG